MPRSYEEISQEAVTMLQGERATQWRLAELAAEAATEVGLTAPQIASDWGLSASHVRRLIRVHRTFPPDTRDATVPFSLYVQALAGDDPQAWIVRAIDHQWSCRDLQEAMAQAKAEDPADVEQRQFDQALQRLRKRWEDTPTEKRIERGAAIMAWYFADVHPVARRGSAS